MIHFFTSLLISTFAIAESAHYLTAENISASSFLESNWNKYQENYHPNYAFDDNPVTAWVEGVEGQGESEQLEWEVSKLISAEEVYLEIKNGYQKSEKLLAANSAPKDVTVLIYGPNHKFPLEKKISLERKMGWQKFAFQLPKNIGLTKLSVRIDSVHPGKTYKDTCVSDIKISVKSQVPYNPAVEKLKQDKISAWIKERLAAADFFAKLPAQYPFVSTSFRVRVNKEYHQNKSKEWITDPKAEFYEKTPNLIHPEKWSEGEKLLAMAATIDQKTGWKKMALKKPVKDFLPDGIELGFHREDKEVLKYFYPQELSFFESSKALAIDEPKETEYGESQKKSHHQVVSKDGTIQSISYVIRIDGVERGPYSSTHSYMFAYQNNQLQWAIKNMNGTEGTFLTMLNFIWNSGKIVEVYKFDKATGDYAETPYQFQHFVPYEQIAKK